MVPTLPITLLTDYGLEDEFAGVCRAVIARLAPDALVIDLSHGISPHNVAEGANVLASALPYAPAGVHVAIVDPGVGSERRGVAVRTRDEGRLLVGPDNGLLSRPSPGSAARSRRPTSRAPRSRLESASATFDGRDLFSPVAAALAGGASLAELGEPLDPAELIALELPGAEIEPGRRLSATVGRVDRFGNAILSLAPGQLGEAGIELGRRVTIEAGETSEEAVVARAFADVPEGRTLVHIDAFGHLAIAVNLASAAERLRIGAGDRVVLWFG